MNVMFGWQIEEALFVVEDFSDYLDIVLLPLGGDDFISNG